MRSLLLVLVSMVWAMPAVAAETFTVPFTVVPRSVTGLLSGVPLPDSVPFSAPIVTPGGSCSFTGTLSAEIVNDGLEIELDLTVAGSICAFGAEANMILEMEVPELGGTVTMVRIRPTVLVADFPFIPASAAMGRGAGGTTSSVDGIVDTSFHKASWTWQPGHDLGYPYPQQNEQVMISLIPGDTVQIPISVDASFGPSTSFVGTLRMRYEFLVTVPEPSAALSLPIGVLTLLGLASLRG